MKKVYLYTHTHIYINTYVCAVSQSRPTLCDPIDCNPPGSSVHGILQARVLEQSVISSTRGSSPPRDQTCASPWQENFYHTQHSKEGKGFFTDHLEWALGCWISQLRKEQGEDVQELRHRWPTTYQTLQAMPINVYSIKKKTSTWELGMTFHTIQLRRLRESRFNYLTHTHPVQKHSCLISV